MNVKMKYCVKCDDLREIEVVQKNEVYTVKGEIVEIEALVSMCKVCGEELFNEELDEQNLQKAYNIYRKRHGLLSPKEIIEIREMYGLSQRAFARVINWGEITMHRYENGSIPEKSHNNLLVLLKNPATMLDMLDRNPKALTPTKEKRLRERIQELLEGTNENAVTQLVNSINKVIGNRSDVYTGFKSFDYEKFKSLVLYFASNEEKLYKTKLMKELWYSDFLYFKNNSVSITGTMYAHLPNGPVIEKRNILLSALEEEGVISLIEDETTKGEYIKVLIKDDIELDSEELKVATYVLDYFKDFNSTRISDFSHKEVGYKETLMGEQISYEYAQYIQI